jgi:hypothetical protein
LGLRAGETGEPDSMTARTQTPPVGSLLKPKRRRGNPTTPLKTHAEWQFRLARKFNAPDGPKIPEYSATSRVTDGRALFKKSWKPDQLAKRSEKPRAATAITPTSVLRTGGSPGQPDCAEPVNRPADLLCRQVHP